MTNDPVRAERSDNIDVGLTVKPIDGLTVGFSGFYKWAENYLDKGQFGAPIFQTAFNYSNAQVRGFELFANYDKGPWSLYANLAWSQVNSINITSSQFNFEQAELDYIASNWIFADHNQSWTGLGRCGLRVQHGRRTGPPGSRPTCSTATACARRSSTPNDTRAAALCHRSTCR